MVRLLTVLALWLGMGPALAFGDQWLVPQVEVGTGLVSGNAYELVLRDGSSSTPYASPVSQLTWPEPLSLSAEAAVLVPWAAWTSTKVSLRAVFPVMSDTLIDEDWNAFDSTTGINLDYGRSQHEARMTSNVSARAEQSVQWEGFSLGLGGLYRWASWEAWNGRGVYRETDYSGVTTTTTDYFSGLVLASRQQWLIPYVSASYSFSWGNVHLSPGIEFSSLAWCFDIDNHNYAGGATTSFLDNTSGGWYGKASLEASLDNGSSASWGIRAEGQMTYGAVGDTTASQTQQQSSSGALTADTVYTKAAGTWFREVAVTVFMRK